MYTMPLEVFADLNELLAVKNENQRRQQAYYDSQKPKRGR